MAKTFEKWKIDELINTFGLKRNREANYQPLVDWLQSSSVITEAEKIALEEIKEDLQDNAEYWNEDELKFFFISPLLKIVNLKSPYYKIFTQRPISVEINHVKMNGIVDFVLAKGEAEPQKPYFFIHEYKQEKKSANDPIAQLLAEMLAAQAQNESEMPLYGCYVMGRFWFFIVLEGNEYAISNAYNSSDEDIFQIVNILRAVKTKVEESIKREQNK
jgi:hypothetical protein